MAGTGQLAAGDACPAISGGLRARGRAYWLAPDMACLGACVTLFYCLFLFQGYQKLFRDSDTGWHIRAGESILLTGTLPRTDPYSFIREGQPWFAWEWGSDVLAGTAYRALGLSGVALVFGLAIAAGVWLWFRLHWAVGGDFLLACALAVPLLSTCNLHWMARPHVLSWMLLLTAVLALEHAGPRLLLEYALLGAVWANLHASFFFAPLFAGLYGLAYLLRPLIWEFDRAAQWRLSRRYFAAAAAAAAASLINPYGWNLHRHLAAYLADSQLLARIGEFQSFDFHNAGSAQILLGLGIATLGAAGALSQRNLAHFFVAALLIPSALRYARALPVAALVLLPLANGAITQALRRARGLQPRLRHGLDAFLAYSARLRTLDAGMSGLALAPLAVLLAFALLRVPAVAARTGFPPDQFPVAAAEQVDRLPAGARLLTPDKFGGYLIYRFAGRRRVFFDGRSDLYGAGFLKAYGRMVQVRPGWRRQLEGFGFTHALLPNDYSLIPALEGIGWTRTYRDGTATLLAAPPRN